MPQSWRRTDDAPPWALIRRCRPTLPSAQALQQITAVSAKAEHTSSSETQLTSCQAPASSVGTSDAHQSQFSTSTCCTALPLNLPMHLALPLTALLTCLMCRCHPHGLMGHRPRSVAGQLRLPAC